MTLEELLAQLAAHTGDTPPAAPEGMTAAVASDLANGALDGWDASKTAGTPNMALHGAVKTAAAWLDAAEAHEARVAAAMTEDFTGLKKKKKDELLTGGKTAGAVDLTGLGAAEAGNTADQEANRPARVASFTATSAAATVGVAQTDAEMDLATLGMVLSETGRTMQANSNGVHVASMRFDATPVGQRLGGDSASHNDQILTDGTQGLKDRAVVALREGRTAAANPNAGFSGAPQYITEIPNCGVDDRPLTGGGNMRTFSIDGTTIKHFRATGLAGYAAGAVIWTDAQQKLVDPAVPSTWKPVVDVAAGVEVVVTPYLEWGAIRYDFLQELQRPNRVAEAQRLIQRLVARSGESQAWDQLITFGPKFGTLIAPVAPQMADLAGLRQVLADLLTDYGYVNRNLLASWSVILPYGFDLAVARGLGARNTDVSADDVVDARAEINGLMRGLGLGDAVFMLDDPSGSGTTWTARQTVLAAGTQNAATLLPSKDISVWPITIYDKQSVFYGRRGILNAKVETSGDLVLQNRALWRMEDMAAIGQDGCNAPITLFTKLEFSGRRTLDVAYVASDPTHAATTAA